MSVPTWVWFVMGASLAILAVEDMSTIIERIERWRKRPYRRGGKR